MNKISFHGKAAGAANLLKILANEHRLTVLCKLCDGECSVSTLEKLVNIRQSALSQHLARLRRNKIVKTRRESQNIFYSLSDERTARIIKELHALYCAPKQ